MRIPGLRNGSALLLRSGAFLLTVGVLLIWGPPVGFNADLPPERGAIPGETTVDFDQGVRLALKQSPFLVKSGLEIQIRRLNETDALSDFTPSVTLRTRFFVNEPTQAGRSYRAYALDFISENYNPVAAYFSLQAQKLFTRVAVLSHMKVIAEGLHRLGRSFLELDTLKKMAEYQEEILELGRKNFLYAEQRQGLGEATTLEVNLSRQELEVAKAEKGRLASAQNRTQEAVKSWLGLPPAHKLHFSLKPTRQQVLGPGAASPGHLEEAQGRSLDLKLQALKKELQEYNIMLAKAQLLPTLYMGVQNPDPLSNLDSSGYFFSLGFTFPVWDGFKRVRNVSRQKIVLRQYEAEHQEKEMEFGLKWREILEQLQAAAVAHKAALAQVELARLKDRQSEIRYYQGGEPFSVFLEGKRGLWEAKKNAALKSLEYDLAQLAVRHLSGELVSRYVDEASWQK